MTHEQPESQRTPGGVQVSNGVAEANALRDFLQHRQGHVHNVIVLADGKAVALLTLSGALLAYLSGAVGWSKFTAISASDLRSSVATLVAAVASIALVLSAVCAVLGVLKPRHRTYMNAGHAVDVPAGCGFAIGSLVCKWPSSEAYAAALREAPLESIVKELACSFYTDQRIATQKFYWLGITTFFFCIGGVATLAWTLLKP
ncbi:MAG TPA: hypothetical protein VEA69_07355 [Tepidisphaeraceae bacterium]|nr:hypothetical protein [Tepidisphaeraceae bacterium]